VERGPTRVAINVSPRQFMDYRFVSKLEQLLSEYELPARCVELELTESVLQTGSHTIKTLDQLRSLGVAIALDDFGTGLLLAGVAAATSADSCETRSKPHRRYREGARRIHFSRDDRAVSRPRSRGHCRGCEHLEQFAMLLPNRAISLQGYLFSRPVPRDELLALLKRMPAHCQELLQQSKKLPAPAHTTLHEKRRAALTLVRD
jgi:hypothetical protein